jgi:hypothetical protein
MITDLLVEITIISKFDNYARISKKKKEYHKDDEC